MVQEYLAELDNDMKEALASVRRELTTVRTGRASPQLLDNVQVHDQAGCGRPLALEVSGHFGRHRHRFGISRNLTHRPHPAPGTGRLWRARL